MPDRPHEIAASSSALLEALIRAIPIHVTQFFRDASAWELLEREVIPRLLDEAGGVPIRAWTAACATGEEAYSLAMVLAEHAGAREGRADFQMFATDTSAEIVARASRGVFNARAVDVLSPQRRHRFFYSADGAFRVKRTLREKMVFAPQDLLADPPFPDLDLVSCRNLLIYLEPDAAKRVVYILHSSLRIGGYLFLGSAESLAYQQPGFEELVPNQRIYRKTGPISDVNIDFPKRPLRMSKSQSSGRVIGVHAGQSSRANVDLAADADDAGEIPTWGGKGATDLTEALRLSHEELESSREELQALNEELRASNDQLNIANEEITRANAQLRGKVTELETQSDVLSSGAVTALFLDEQLRIRWFTRAVDRLFPALTSDTGRCITDLAPKFDDPAFIGDAQSVMQTGEPREAEILTFDGRWYLKRVRPFRTGGKAGLGVAITFTDVTDRKAAETVLRQSEAALSAELEAMTRLHDFSAAILDTRTVQELVDLALDAVISLHHADFGNVQLYDAQASVLRIAAQRGFDNWFLEHFAQVDARHASACGQALALGERVSFEDIETEKSAESLRAAATRAGFRAVQSTPLTTAGGTPLGMISTHFRQPRRLTDVEHRLTDIVAHALSLAIERVRAEHALSEREQALRRNQALLRAQKEAFQLAMNGAPLATSLEILVRVVVQQFQGECRSAFYISDRKGTGLHHVVGMSDSYARRVDGFEISPESLACNLAVATGEPVVTPDVFEEPRWQPWIWLAREYDYRACWSFPVEILSGKLVGSLAMYFREPRAPTPRDYEFAAAITQTAAIIIFRQETDERAQAGAAPRDPAASENLKRDSARI
jgi:chemotaxis methyl-accepting protein methylase/GAF domain-containing protein